MKHKSNKKRKMNYYLLLMAVLIISQLFTVLAIAQAPTGKTMPKPDSTLSNTYWKVVELSGSPVSLGAGKKELHLILNDAQKQAKGFAGCNNFSGRFKQKEQQITFGPMAATMMACMEGMDQEQQFLQTLGKVKHFSISGETLLLYDAESHVLLRLNAVFLQ